MITIYIDTTMGIVVKNDEEDDVNDVFTNKLIQEVANAAMAAFNRCMGVGEVLH